MKKISSKQAEAEQKDMIHTLVMVVHLVLTLATFGGWLVFLLGCKLAVVLWRSQDSLVYYSESLKNELHNKPYGYQTKKQREILARKWDHS